MKPDDLVPAIEARVAEAETTLEKWRAVLAAVREAFGLGAIVGTVCPPSAAGRIVRAYNRRAKKPRTTRAGVRRGNAKAAKALRGPSGQRRALAAGSLSDRIVEALTAFSAPMKKSKLIDQVKAPADAVVADLKRLRADGRIVMVGEKSAARYAVPKFANVIVAEDAA